MTTIKGQKWYPSEIKGCDIAKMKHLGGPNQPDCADEGDPSRVGEVKDWNRDFTAGDLRREMNKPHNDGKAVTFVIMNGCSKKALEEAKKYGGRVKLICNASTPELETSELSIPEITNKDLPEEDQTPPQLQLRPLNQKEYSLFGSAFFDDSPRSIKLKR